MANTYRPWPLYRLHELAVRTLCAKIKERALVQESFREAPAELGVAVKSRPPRIKALLAQHPQALDAFAGLPLSA